LQRGRSAAAAGASAVDAQVGICYIIIIMNKTITAIYEKGILRPSRRLSLPEHQRVTLRLMEPDDVPAAAIKHVAGKSRSYSFLKRKGENIYSLKDGRPV